MKKHLPIYIYGVIIILEGIFLLFSINYPFQTIKLTLGCSLILGGLLAFIKTLTRQTKQVEFSYHNIHSFSMLIYGISVLLFAYSIESLIYISAFLFMFYTFSEIIFCIWIFNLGKEVVAKIVIIRTLLGLVVGFGTIIILYYLDEYKPQSIVGCGILFIIIGINILLYVPSVTTKDLPETSKQ